MHSKCTCSLCLAAMLTLGLHASADESSEGESQEEAAQESVENIEELVVRAHPLGEDGLAQSTELLQGADLQRAAQSTLGETVEMLPGVRNSSFGPGVGRPIIQGMHGVRVRTMADQINTMDLSTLTVDHSVTIDSFMADSIELIKGPTAMTYGTESIGGLINVSTGRVPVRKPENDINYRVTAFGTDNAEKQTFAGRLQAAIEDVVIHGDVTSQTSSDYKSPACLESHYYHEFEEQEHHEDEHHDEHEDEHEDEHHDEHEDEDCGGTVPNSFVESLTGSLGASWINDHGYVGFSVTHNDVEYGIPIPHSHAEEEDDHDDHDDHDEDHADDHDDDHDDDHADEDEHGHEEADAYLTLNQTKYDFALKQDQFSDAIDELQFRLAVSEYEHDEVDGHSGEVEASYLNDAYEMRLDLKLDRPNSTVVSTQLSGREYEVKTVHDPVLPVTVRRLGVSWLHERPLNTSSLEFSTRAEYKKVDSDAFDDRTFSNFAVSLGLVSDPMKDWVFRLSADASSRAPIAEELASLGLHAGTGAVEVGNPLLNDEQLRGLTLSASNESGRLETSFSAYHRRFGDFIFLGNTGAMDHGAPVFNYQQKDATFVGYEIGGLYHLSISPQTELDIRAQFDSVETRTDRTKADPLPQLPSDRAIVGFDLFKGHFFASLNVTRSFAVTNTAEFELPTDSWTDISGVVEYEFKVAEASALTLYLKGRNLTDEEKRDHVSPIKDRVPLPGRMIEFGFRLTN